MPRRRGDLNLDLSLQRFRYFLSVFDLGSINQAAATIGISQQALSKSLRILEKSMSVELFDRTPAGMVPTIYAQRLAERARNILIEAEMAASELEALRGFRSEHVRVGAGPTMAARRVPNALIELRKRLPDVGISVVVGNTDHLMPQLLAGQLDMIVSAPVDEVIMPDSIEYSTFASEYDEVVARADHPLRKKTDLKVADFARYAWIGEEATSHVIQRASKVFSKRGISPFVDVITTNSIEMMRSLIIATDALSLLHPELYSNEAKQGLIKPFDMTEFRMKRYVRLFRRQGVRPLPAVRLMLEIFERQLKQDTPP